MKRKPKGNLDEVYVVIDKDVDVVQGECDIFIDTDTDSIIVPGNVAKAFMEKLKKIDLDTIEKNYHYIHKG